MYRLALPLLLLAVSTAGGVRRQSTPVVEVTVYYDATGADSANFITKQLYPTYVTLNQGRDAYGGGQRLSVRLVPYIDARDEKSLRSTCGEILLDNNFAGNHKWGCVAAKVHTCAATRLLDNWHQINYVNCLLLDGYKKAPECATLTCVDDSVMPPCVNSVDGDLEMIASSNRTREAKVPTASLPAITLDGGAFNAEDTQLAKTNLLKLLCDKYTVNFEGFCNSPRAKRTMTHKNFGSDYYYPEKRRCNF